MATTRIRKQLSHITRLALLAVVTALLFACVSSENRNPWYALERLTGHESVAVSAPANLGAVVGGAVGLPLAVLALPITVPTAVLTGSEGDSNLLPLAPLFMTSQLGAVVLGGPSWVVTDSF